MVESALRAYWKDVALNGHRHTDMMTYPLHVPGENQCAIISVQGEIGSGYWNRKKDRREVYKIDRLWP